MWDSFIMLSESLQIFFEGHCGFGEKHVEGNHTNIYYKSEKVDLAHISIIDMRLEKKMWMMHVAIFAKDEYPMPIYGYDVICGPKKVSGCFHDLSPTTGESLAYNKFSQLAQNMKFKRERELPDWAKAIFSDNMIAAGNVTDNLELRSLHHAGLYNAWNWFDEISDIPEQDTSEIHAEAKTRYCTNQLKNNNSNNVMVALGLDKDYVKKFKRIQFPY